MTASQFKDARLLCMLSVPAAAKLLRISERTVINWESGRYGIPYAAFKLMRLMRHGELPHPDWHGYRIAASGVLYSPEGMPFHPGHGRWWSLTCRMADEFRAGMRRLHAVRVCQREAMPAPGGGSVDTHEQTVLGSGQSRPVVPPGTALQPPPTKMQVTPPPPTGAQRLAPAPAPSSNTGLSQIAGLLVISAVALHAGGVL